MTEVKPMTIADQQHEQGAARPATGPTPQVHHHHEPAPVLGVSATPPTEGPGKALAELRASSDPHLFDRVIAYHPHAGDSDLHMQQFKEDYERQKEAGEKQRSERDKAAADAKTD
jgi:hypothetical protein